MIRMHNFAMEMSGLCWQKRQVSAGCLGRLSELVGVDGQRPEDDCHQAQQFRWLVSVPVHTYHGIVRLEAGFLLQAANLVVALRSLSIPCCDVSEFVSAAWSDRVVSGTFTYES